MEHTDPQDAAESRRSTAYGAIGALELAAARARAAAAQDPTPHKEAAAAKAHRALQAGWLEIDRAEIERRRAAEDRDGWTAVLELVKLAQETVKAWDEDPSTADYRVSDAADGLRRAVKALAHLSRGEQYPEWQAHRDQFVKRMGDDTAA